MRHVSLFCDCYKLVASKAHKSYDSSEIPRNLISDLLSQKEIFPQYFFISNLATNSERFGEGASDKLWCRPSTFMVDGCGDTSLVPLNSIANCTEISGTIYFALLFHSLQTPYLYTLSETSGLVPCKRQKSKLHSLSTVLVVALDLFGIPGIIFSIFWLVYQQFKLFTA